MKNLLSIAIFCSLLFTGSNMIAQVGIGTTTPDANAQLDISSPDKGLLIPRMTEAARVGMGTTATNGLLVYQTDVSTGFYFRQNDAWVKLPNSPASTIIPYASGAPVSLSSETANSAATLGFVGFGSSVSTAGTTNTNDGNLNLSGSGAALLSYAFSMPRAGIIESISGYFSTTIYPNIPNYIFTDVTAQLYSSTTPNNIFTPVPGGLVVLEPNNYRASAGTVFNGIRTGLSIPMAAQTRLLMVYRVISTEPGSAELEGHAGGGVSIAGQ